MINTYSKKETFELNAEQAGAIKTIAKEGDTLNIGDVVCSIDTDAEKPAEVEKAPEVAKAAVSAQPQTPKSQTGTRVSRNDVSPLRKFNTCWEL